MLLATGTYEGLLAAVVDLGPNGVPLDPDKIVEDVLRQTRASTYAVAFKDAPWGSPELDRSLLALQSHPRTSGLLLWASRTAGDTGWPSYPLWTVLDVTSIACHRSMARLSVELAKLPYAPSPSEVVVRADPAVLEPAVLDEIVCRLHVDSGWLYSPRATQDRAEALISRCATVWGWRP